MTKADRDFIKELLFELHKEWMDRFRDHTSITKLLMELEHKMEETFTEIEKKVEKVEIAIKGEDGMHTGLTQVNHDQDKDINELKEKILELQMEMKSVGPIEDNSKSLGKFIKDHKIPEIGIGGSLFVAIDQLIEYLKT